MRKFVQIRRHNKRRTNYHDEDDNDANLRRPPTRVEHANEQPDTETLAADVLQSANTKINGTAGGGRLDSMKNGNAMTIYLNLHTLKQAEQPG